MECAYINSNTYVHSCQKLPDSEQLSLAYNYTRTSRFDYIHALTRNVTIRMPTSLLAGAFVQSAVVSERAFVSTTHTYIDPNTYMR